MLSQRWGTIISLTHSLANSYSLIPSCRKTYSLAIQVAIGPFNVQILGIFRYLDRLICEVVKPTKLLFIGVDGTHTCSCSYLFIYLLHYLFAHSGCAPRAKLNQQRSRRYLATMNSNNKSNKDKFDICSITPGTEFMWKVSRHIKWFIRHRIKHSLDWQKLTIIYSGVEVPGIHCSINN